MRKMRRDFLSAQPRAHLPYLIRLNVSCGYAHTLQITTYYRTRVQRKVVPMHLFNVPLLLGLKLRLPRHSAHSGQWLPVVTDTQLRDLPQCDAIVRLGV